MSDMQILGLICYAIGVAVGLPIGWAWKAVAVRRAELKAEGKL